MATRNLDLRRHFNAPPSEVFKYFVQPNLIEKWSAPEGMTLKVPQFENKKGGHYRYEHTAKDGVYVCTGQIKEYIPNEKLVMEDTVKSPDGKILADKQPSIIEFKDSRGGCDLILHQDNFPSEEFYQECKQGWNYCLDTLEGLLSSGVDQARASA